MRLRRAGLPFFKSLNWQGFGRSDAALKRIQIRPEIDSIRPAQAHRALNAGSIQPLQGQEFGRLTVLDELIR